MMSRFIFKQDFGSSSFPEQSDKNYDDGNYSDSSPGFKVALKFLMAVNSFEVCDLTRIIPLINYLNV